jgi:restriction endonuclease
MGSRRLSSRNHARTSSKSKQTTRRTSLRSERSTTGALIFFLIMFLILLVLLLQARISQEQAILLGLILLALIVCISGTWLVRRRRASLSMGSNRESSTRVFRVPAALPLSQSVTLAHLLQLSPGEFEDFVGDLLTATGQYSAMRRVGGAGDRGADLLARDRFGRPFIVQCKRYHPGHKVSAGEVRNFLGAKGIYGADECLFVTTSTFTEAARNNLAQFRQSVFLMDGTSLVQLAEKYWDTLSTRWQRPLLE